MAYETATKLVMALTMAASAWTGDVAGGDAVPLKSLSDEARKRIYVLVRDGVHVLDAGTRRTAARITLRGWTWADEPYGCIPAMAFSPEGDLLVTSNVVPVIWRVGSRTLEKSVHELALDQDRDKDVGFCDLQWSRELGVYVASTELGATWHIDPLLARARKVASGSETQAPSASSWRARFWRAR